MKRAEDLIERISDAFPAVSSGEDDPMIDGLLALSELQHFLNHLEEEMRRAIASVTLEFYGGSRSRTANILRDVLNE